MQEAVIESSDIAPEESPILDALEQFAQFVDEIYDGPRDRAVAWEGNPSRVAIRSVGRVVCKWRHAVKPNRPPSALIVRLARRLPSVLTDVTQHPKRVLQRRRAMEPINRLRELDSTCVRWLTRQPGNTLAEKSGHRRAVLAVQRFESVDTLENRVVFDLLKRCSKLASNYLRQHQARFPKHPWIRMTADFLKLCRRLESLPHLREVSGLPSLPKPNYVLLHETRYKQVWRSYMEVIRQQRRRQHLWIWRHEAFMDMLTVAWMNSASRSCVDRTQRKTAHRFDLRIREIPLRGTFFDWAAPPPIWRISPDRSFYIGPTDSAGQLSSVDDHAGGGTSIVVWEDGKARCTSLSLGLADDQVTVLLQSIQNAEASAQRVAVPLPLIEQPHALDTMHQQWCGS
ncbi:DUF2357 domain-containing protein [Allorhodopirellula solitaria]|uniref:DUF2357 domain-containing protein n=1 Tax=Allorhodopirellula solitaria TaxID=2527987 RepID=A0A5C5X0W8_9BACT|nr:DUF2357 domain-containing protein [Allorhodopirellula solitaria]TWT56450.1 hypothetical protein CA85_42630 [Allorhodopirellula solitaria]